MRRLRAQLQRRVAAAAGLPSWTDAVYRSALGLLCAGSCRRRNYSDESPRLRDFHPWTDVCGNTLRAVLESLLGVVAGANRA